MILIADSGSTKTDWGLIGDNVIIGSYKTQGINPFHQSRDTIMDVVEKELMPMLDTKNIDALYFYGSGCTNETSIIVRDVITSLLPDVKDIEVNGDLLGAARALCGKKEGIACILGTGANSCLYDGEKVIKNTPPLGYILGDEGSGAVLGKRFFNLMFKGGLSSEICNAYLESEQMTIADVIRRVYREPMANRFLASTSLFIHENLACEQLNDLVVDNFRDFIRRNILQYERRDLPVNAIGSMAYYYKEQFLAALASEGFLEGTVERSPMDGLLIYHNE